MPSPIRVGFIGAGRMANLHAELLQREPDVEIVAAADVRVDQAAVFAGKWGGVAFDDHRTLLDNTALDAVYICTPTPHHAAIGLDCLEHDVALFVEKPLDLDLQVAYALVMATEARGTIAMTAFQWRYTEAYRRAEELIGDDPVALVNLRWYWTRPPIRWMWDREQAGGQIVDQSIHLIDVGRGLAGEVTAVYAAYSEDQTNPEPEFKNWDGYALTLKYASGAVGVCAGTYALFPEIQMEPAADFCLRYRMVRVTDKRVQLFTPTGVTDWPNTEPLHLGVNRAFIAAVRTGDPTLIRTPLRAGLESTAVVLAANRSAATGQPIRLDAFLAAEVAPRD